MDKGLSYLLSVLAKLIVSPEKRLLEEKMNFFVTQQYHNSSILQVFHVSQNVLVILIDSSK